MRFVNGVLFGIVLTIGTAYIVDTMHSAPGPDNKEAERMVNWTVVSANLRGLSSDVQSAWDNFMGKVKEEDKKAGA